MVRRRSALMAILVAGSLAWWTGLLTGSVAAASSKPFTCRMVGIGGKKWLIYGTNLSCSTATAVVRVLVKKPAPRGPTYDYPGFYSGLACYRPKNGGIYCGNKKQKEALEAIPE